MVFPPAVQDVNSPKPSVRWPTIATACVPILLLLGACSSETGAAEQACSDVYAMLASGSYSSLTRSRENFVADGASRGGCVLRFTARADRITDGQRPDVLFGLPLPYCPDGVLAEDLAPAQRNASGWCVDRAADGKDGTSYRALNSGVFCLVEARWDGGNDGDPGYVPSLRYDITVRCAPD